MKKIALWALVVLALTSCGKPAAPAPEAAPASAPAAEEGQKVSGLVTSVTGKVEIQRPGETAWSDVKVKDPLPIGARIRAGADGEADLLLAERSAVRLKPGTEMVIENNRLVQGAPRIEVKIETGRLMHRFDRLPAGSQYTVRSPSAVAGIRGTQFDMSAGADRTSVRCLTGRVEVTTDAGRVEVSERQGTEAAAGAAPAAPKTLTQQDVDQLLECSLIKFTVALERARRIATAAEMRNISMPLEVYAATHDGRYPNTLAEADAGGMTDNWNTPYRYQVLDGGKGFVIISNGPDKQPDTDDDIEYRR